MSTHSANGTSSPTWTTLRVVAIVVLAAAVGVGVGVWVAGSLKSPDPLVLQSPGAEVVAKTIGDAPTPAPKPAPTPPVVPIKVGVRKAQMGEGYVLTFHNDGESHLEFTVTHRRLTLNQASPFELRLDPGTETERGWKEGHVFYPGDTVVIEHPSHSRRVITVNPGSGGAGIDVVEGRLP